MERWTGEQRVIAVKAYWKNNDSYEAARREFRRHYQLRRHDPVPSAHAIKTWVRKLETTGSSLKKKSPGPRRTVRTPETIQAVNAAMQQSPQRSARRHAVSLGLSRRTMGRILFSDLKLHPYKLQIIQQLQPGDANNRINFAQMFLAKCEENEMFLNNVWMSDEAHFHLSGYVNKQNFRYWAAENPHFLHQKPLHSEKVTVWCAVSRNGIIGPYFFEDNDGHAVTVNSERYVNMIETFLTNEIDVNESTWFQQDGATAHTARISMAALRHLFGDRLISRNGNMNWPARSPDLSMCDYFLWGFLKDSVYRSRPRTINELKARIRDTIATISIEMLRRVTLNLCSRLQECVRREGRHLQDVVFKK